MIRKTKHIKSLVRNDHGHLDLFSESVTIDDVLLKLYRYEQMERNEMIMEVADAGWYKYSYDGKYMCSHCGSITSVPDIDGQPGYRFCPYCNARMHGRKYKT